MTVEGEVVKVRSSQFVIALSYSGIPSQVIAGTSLLQNA
jgi:hypothetical protein